MSKKLLPLGTVVNIKGTEKAMMICGYCPTGPAKSGYVYDYSGFPYPEGYVDMMKIYQFNHEQIEGIIAYGYQERESYMYVHQLSEKLDEIKKRVAEEAADEE